MSYGEFLEISFLKSYLPINTIPSVGPTIWHRSNMWETCQGISESRKTENRKSPSMSAPFMSSLSRKCFDQQGAAEACEKPGLAICSIPCHHLQRPLRVGHCMCCTCNSSRDLNLLFNWVGNHENGKSHSGQIVLTSWKTILGSLPRYMDY